MKQVVNIDYIYASTYASAQLYARTAGIEPGWKFLYSLVHIYGTKNATVLVCECARTREDYEQMFIEFQLRSSKLIYQPYSRELL